MKLQKFLIIGAVSALVSYSAFAATRVTAGSWGDTYSEAYYGAINNLQARYPNVHSISVGCCDMNPAYKCSAVGYIN